MAVFRGDVEEEAAQRRFEVTRGVEEVDYLGGWQVLGVLGAGERELGEGEAGISIGRGGAKVANVERSVSDGDGDVVGAVDDLVR